MTFEIGIMTFGEVTKDPVTGRLPSPQQRVRETIEQARIADEVNLDVFGVGEHHRSDFVGSAPAILLAAAAEATERIRLTSSVTVLSSEDPMRVWEQFATIDLLSAGRAEIIVGRGSYAESFPLFGYDLRDYADLFREKLDLLLKIREQNPLTWSGRFRTHLVDADIAPPADGDTIPIWVGVGGSPASAISTGRLGLPMALALLLGPVTLHEQTVELYRAAAEKVGHDPATLPISINVHGYVGQTSQEARETMYPYFAAGMAENNHQQGAGFPLSRAAFDAQAVEFGTGLVSFEQSDEGVSAMVVKGGEAEAVTARWLVGCDGGHSIVRKQAGIAFEGETREEVRMIVADVEVDGLDRDAWHAWRHDEGLISLCPLPSTDVFQYQAVIAPGQDPELSVANMQAILERRSGRTDIRLHKPEWSSLWRANIRLVDRYREGRVFLAGDAAHIHSPAGGQGMNTGIQDAYNLGWKLAAVAKGASPALLDSYEAERRPVAAGVLALSNARLKQTLEQNDIPTRRDASTLQLDVGYRGSALARDDRDETALLRAGDLAPDATKLTTTEGERRLFDLTRGGRFTLLSFGAMPAVEASPSDLRTLHVVGQPTDPDDIADTEGHLAGAYGAADRTLVLIRPDGYVALISDAGDVSAVSDYLSAIG